MAYGQSMRKPLYPDASHAHSSTTNDNPTTCRSRRRHYSCRLFLLPFSCGLRVLCPERAVFSLSCRQANSDVSFPACTSREELALSRLPCRSCHVVREGWPHMSSSPVVMHLLGLRMRLTGVKDSGLAWRCMVRPSQLSPTRELRNR